MANETNTPNMGLPVPGVGVTDGPDYATDINTSLTIIDQHSHVSGSGVPITPSAININADFTQNNNNLTQIRTSRYYPQTAALALASDILCLYVVAADLYYNDASGNQVRITSGGSVAGAAGTITGLPSGTASASYATSTFVFQAATSTAANIDGGSYLLRNSTPSSNALTLSPPSAMGSNYSIVLPALPATEKFVSLDAVGNMTAAWAVDNSTLEISSNSIRVKDAGITPAKLSAFVTNTSSLVATFNTAASYTNTSSPGAAVTGLAATITASGTRPVMVTCRGTQSSLNLGSFSAAGLGIVTIYRNGAFLSLSAFTGVTTPSAVSYLDTTAPAGSVTYQIYIGNFSGSSISASGVYLNATQL